MKKKVGSFTYLAFPATFFTIAASTSFLFPFISTGLCQYIAGMNMEHYIHFSFEMMAWCLRFLSTISRFCFELFTMKNDDPLPEYEIVQNQQNITAALCCRALE